MAYDEVLASRVRQLLRRQRGFSERTMFGGLGFLLNGNMCVGIWKELLILRVGPDRYKSARTEPFTREFDITGRPMMGWIMVEPDGVEDEADLRRSVESAVQFVKTLPAK